LTVQRFTQFRQGFDGRINLAEKNFAHMLLMNTGVFRKSRAGSKTAQRHELEHFFRFESNHDIGHG